MKKRLYLVKSLTVPVDEILESASLMMHETDAEAEKMFFSMLDYHIKMMRKFCPESPLSNEEILGAGFELYFLGTLKLSGGFVPSVVECHLGQLVSSSEIYLACLKKLEIEVIENE